MRKTDPRQIKRFSIFHGPLLAIMWGLASALPTVSQPSQEVTATSPCNVLAAPERWDGETVELRARVISGFEVFALRDVAGGCDGLVWLTYPGGGPQASVSIRSQNPAAPRPPVTLVRDDQFEEFQQLLSAEMHSRDRRNICFGCTRYRVTATLRGRIEFAGSGLGFGHLNGYPTRMVLERVSEIDAEDMQGNYDPQFYSATPVRFPAGVLTGRVVRGDEGSVESLDVTALSLDDVPLYLRDFSDWTDDQGRFAIEVPPGRYVVGTNVDDPPSPELPYPTTFAPGVVEKELADQLFVSDLETIEVEIRLTDALEAQQVPVRVLWPDGTPAQRANVWLAEEQNPYWVVGERVSHTDEDGRFVLTGFANISYILRANIYFGPFYSPHCAPRQVLAELGSVVDEIVLTLTESGDGCRSSY